MSPKPPALKDAVSDTADTPEVETPNPGASSGAAAQRQVRLAKLDALRARGIDPYPVSYPRDHMLGEIREKYGHLAAGEETQDVVRVAGRVMLERRQGGLDFLLLHDQSGSLQLMASRKEMGEEAFADVNDLDLGDWVGAEGRVICSRTGELSVWVHSIRLLGKALRPLPAKGRPITDPELRARQRYLDLIVNPESRRVADVRTKTLAAIRTYFASKGFVEVETPVLQSDAGGATARPFITYHNALGIQMYMRIALELHLKRLIVGGFEKVFEVGRVFRNEGVDTRHNPEFTMLEAYQALADYHDMMTLTEELVSYCAIEATGSTVIHVNGEEVDLKPPWRRATMSELIKEYTGLDIQASTPVEEARRIAEQAGVEWEEDWGAGKIIDGIYDEHVEHNLVGPIFVCDHPREISPLARAHRDDPTLVERFEVVVAGRELANAYSELTDPVDQRERFEAEARAKAAGDLEAGDVDEDYLRAMELGMPPTGGLGVGVDRLVMLLTEAPAIRDVILFPTLRPEATDTGGEEEDGAETEDRDEPPAHAEPPPLRLTSSRRPSQERRSFLATLVALAGLLALLAPLPGLHSPLDPLGGVLAPLGVRAGGAIASVIIGLLAILVALQLARGKRTAWIAAVSLLGLSTAVNIIKGPHPIAALLTLLLLLALVHFRDDFRAKPDPPSIWAAVRFVPIWLAAVLLYGTVALLLERNRITPELTFGGVMDTIFSGLIGLDGPYTYQARFFREFFPDSLIALGIAGILILAFLIFRPITQRHHVSEDDRAKAEDLVHRYGWDTLAYFALRDDKSLFFSSDGKAMIAYAYLQGHALASGDPIGAPESVPLVVDEFMAFCEERGWRVAFLAVRESDLPMYEAQGMKSVYLGDEAIIRCDRLDLSRPQMKKLRQAVSHVAKDHEFEMIREDEASPELVGRLNAISEAWRQGNPERGFTMDLGTDVTGTSAEMLLCVARDAGGAPIGFLRLVPCFGDDPGYSLDLMRRIPEAPNGTTEFLIVRAAEALKEQGVRRLSMNFAAWGRLFQADADLGWRDKAMRWVIGKLNPYFQIKSLYDFNSRFEPEWLPRVMVVEDSADLPHVGILYAGVEGFLTMPKLGPLIVPPVVAGPSK